MVNAALLAFGGIVVSIVSLLTGILAKKSYSDFCTVCNLGVHPVTLFSDPASPAGGGG